MNNAAIFWTHATLGHRHAAMSLAALGQYGTTFPSVYIYNTHADELPNDDITDVLVKNRLSLSGIIPYDEFSPKTVSYDLMNIDKFVSKMKDVPERVLVLKSDYVLSSGLDLALRKLPSNNFIWTLPIMNAKEFVTDNEIVTRAKGEFCISDSVTYYRGSDLFQPMGEVGATMDTDPSIRFISHNVKRDLNCHVFSGDVFGRLGFGAEELSATWGGPAGMFCRAMESGIQFPDERGAFAIHVFHDIVSKNRVGDRGDPRKTVLGQRY